jgi:hypothetical protein
MRLYWKTTLINQRRVDHDLYDTGTRCTLYLVREVAGKIVASVDGLASTDMQEFSTVEEAKAVCEANYLLSL